MGACASKFSVLKNSADAPPPAPKEELASREVKLVEETGVEKDDAPPVAASDEAKHQSLGLLFKENEGEKGSAESNGNASEEFKQENENVKSSEPVVDAPAKDETEKAEDSKPASENVETGKRIEEKAVETVNLETAKKKVDMLNTGKPEENNPGEAPGNDHKHETPEMEKLEEQKPASDSEKKKEEEEKPAETVTLEKKPETPETEEKTEEKLNEIIKIGTSDEVEDKHVLEPQKMEESSDEKHETLQMSSEEKKPGLDAEKPKAEEEKAMK